MKKRVLLIIMTIALCFGLVPVSTFAVETVDEITSTGGYLASGDYALTADVVFDAGAEFIIPAESEVTVDLATYALKGQTTEVPIVRNYGTLTLKNGALVRTAGDYYSIINYGTIVLENLTMDSGSVTISASLIENLGTMTINSGTYRTKGANVIKNEPSATKLTINGGEFVSQYAKSGAGVIMNYSVVEINGGIFTGETKSNYLFWYDAENATTTPVININGGTFNAYNASSSNAFDSDARTVAKVTRGNFNFTMSGSTMVDENSAVVFSSTEASKWDSEIYPKNEIATMIAEGKIVGRQVISKSGSDNYYKEEAKFGALMEVTSKNGNYDYYLYQTPTETRDFPLNSGYIYNIYMAEGVSIDGVNFTTKVSGAEVNKQELTTLPEGIVKGYRLTVEPKMEDAAVEVLKADGTHYAYAVSLSDAVKMVAEATDVVKVLKDMGGEAEIKLTSVTSGNFVLDLNGKTLTTSSSYQAIGVYDDDNMVIKDSVGGGKIIAAGKGNVVVSFAGQNGTLELQGGTLVGNIESDGIGDPSEMANNLKLMGGNIVPVEGAEKVTVLMADRLERWNLYLAEGVVMPEFKYEVSVGTEVVVTDIVATDLPTGVVSGKLIASPATENSAAVKVVAADGTLKAYYDSFSTAASLEKDPTIRIVLLKDIGEGTDYKLSSSNAYLSSVKGVVDLNGHTITGAGTTSTAKRGVINAGSDDLTIVDSVGTGVVKTTTETNNVIYVKNGNLTIEGGTFDGNLNFDANGTGSLMIKGGTFAFNPTDYVPSGYGVVEFVIEGDKKMWAVGPNLETISVAEDTILIAKGDSRAVEAVLNPTNALQKEVVWTSDDEDVVIVDANGGITGVGAGVARIKVESKNNPAIFDTVEVVVYEVAKPTEEGDDGDVSDKEIIDLHDEIIGLVSEIFTNQDEVIKTGKVDAETAKKIVDAVKEGKVINAKIVVESLAKENFPVDEIEKAESALKDGESVGIYLDLRIELSVDGGVIGEVKELSKLLGATLKIPEELRGENREYFIVRVHNGIAKRLATTLSATGEELTFYTDSFSTYMLAYANKVVNAPNAGENTVTEQSASKSSTITITFATMMVMFGMVLFAIRRIKR